MYIYIKKKKDVIYSRKIIHIKQHNYLPLQFDNEIISPGHRQIYPWAKLGTTSHKPDPQGFLKHGSIEKKKTFFVRWILFLENFSTNFQMDMVILYLYH